MIFNLTQKAWARLKKTIALFLAGFAITCIPTVIYCVTTQSFTDMVTVYFIGNIWGEHATADFIERLHLLLHLIYKDITVVLLILFGIASSIKTQNNKVRLLLLATSVPTFLASCCLSVLVRYYPITMIAFVPFGIVALRNIRVKCVYAVAIVSFFVILHLFISDRFSTFSPIIGNNINLRWLKEYIWLLAKASTPLLILIVALKHKQEIRSKTILCVGSILLIVGAMFYCYYVRDPLYFTIKSLPQIQFAETIKQIDNANLLVYKSIDHGFFRLANTYPQVKYFCTLNLIPDDMESEQLSYIHNEIVDFIIAPYKLDDEVQDTSYRLIDVSGYYYFVGNNKQFYLYGK